MTVLVILVIVLLAVSTAIGVCSEPTELLIIYMKTLSMCIRVVVSGLVCKIVLNQGAANVLLELIRNPP